MFLKSGVYMEYSRHVTPTIAVVKLVFCNVRKENMIPN